METDFQRAVKRLNALQAEIAVVSERGDQDWKRELVALRRKLQAQLTTVRQIAVECDRLGQKPDLARRFADEFSRMRSALAYHQSDWPAVKIDLSNPDYIRSVATVREANRAFVQLANEIIDLLNI